MALTKLMLRCLEMSQNIKSGALSDTVQTNFSWQKKKIIIMIIITWGLKYVAMNDTDPRWYKCMKAQKSKFLKSSPDDSYTNCLGSTGIKDPIV